MKEKRCYTGQFSSRHGGEERGNQRIIEAFPCVPQYNGFQPPKPPPSKPTRNTIITALAAVVIASLCGLYGWQNGSFVKDRASAHQLRNAP